MDIGKLRDLGRVASDCISTAPGLLTVAGDGSHWRVCRVTPNVGAKGAGVCMFAYFHTFLLSHVTTMCLLLAAERRE